MPTREDVIRAAFRHLGILAEDEALNADQVTYASEAMASLEAEIALRADLPPLGADVPPELSGALALLLAAHLAPSYGLLPPVTRARAMLMLMAALRPDDRLPAEQAQYF